MTRARTAAIASVFVALFLILSTGTGVAQQAPAEEFNETFGGTGFDRALSVMETSGGGLVFAGATNSFGARDDAWLIKTDLNGNEIFNKTFGGTNGDISYSVIETSDGGFALAGEADSFGAGGDDAWLIKTDSNGNEEFNKTFGGAGKDLLWSMIETSDGGFALTGGTTSFGDEPDAWLVKTDSEGNEVFNKTFGGTNVDTSRSVTEMSDGGFALAGITTSFGVAEDDTGIAGDALLIKTEGEEPLSPNNPFGDQNNRPVCVSEAADVLFSWNQNGEVDGVEYTIGEMEDLFSRWDRTQ